MMNLLDNSPYDYIINSTDKEIDKLNIKHRLLMRLISDIL